jgi:hypothetical protein
LGFEHPKIERCALMPDVDHPHDDAAPRSRREDVLIMRSYVSSMTQE